MKGKRPAGGRNGVGLSCGPINGKTSPGGCGACFGGAEAQVEPAAGLGRGQGGRQSQGGRDGGEDGGDGAENP